MAVTFTYCGSSVQVLKASSVCISKPTQIYTHLGDSFTLHFIDSGKGVLESPDGQFALSENTLFVTGSSAPHRQIPESSAPLRSLNLFLVIRHSPKAEGVLRYFTENIFLPRTVHAEIGVLFKRILHEYANPSPWSENTLCALVIELITEIVKLYAPNPAHLPTDPKTDLNESRALVLDELLQNVCMHGALEDFAKALGVCPRQAERILSAFYGSTFRKLRHEARMAHAAALLEAGNTSVEQCAQSCGYASVTSFNKAFKQKYGLTPKSYRLEKKNTKL